MHSCCKNSKKNKAKAEAKAKENRHKNKENYVETRLIESLRNFLCFWFVFHPQINHPHNTCHNQQPGDILRLRGFHSEDIDIRVGAYLFDKKPLDTIEEDV